MGLTYAPGIDHSAVIRDEAGRIAAAASLDRNMIKCAAVRPDLQGTGLMASLITHLRQESVSRGGEGRFRGARDRTGSSDGGPPRGPRGVGRNRPGPPRLRARRLSCCKL